MGNGASVVMLSKVIKFKLIDGWRHPFFPHLFRLTFASAVVPLLYVNESERERERDRDIALLERAAESVANPRA